jgi:hypothetical protein
VFTIFLEKIGVNKFLTGKQPDPFKLSSNNKCQRVDQKSRGLDGINNSFSKCFMLKKM